MSYTGGGPVDNLKPIYVFLSNNALFQGSSYSAVTLLSADGTYNFTSVAPGTYYMGAVYDATGTWSPFSGNAPPTGDYYYIYGGGSNGCTLNASLGVTVSGNTIGPTLAFGNGCGFSATNSLSGTVTYNGGTVAGPLSVILFTNPDILEGSPVTSVSMSATLGTYNFTGLTTGNYYLVAVYNTGVATHYVPINGYYDVYGGGTGGCSLVSTTPVFVSGATTGPSLTFGNSCAYYANGSLSGAVTYNGSGTVGTNNKVWVMLFNTSQVEGGMPLTYTSFTTATGTYSFNTLSSGPVTTGPYYLVAIYDSVGGWGGPGGSAPPNGDSYFAYGGGNGGCDLDPTAVLVNGTTAGPALTFADSCKFSQALTLSGTVNYTGGGTVNSTYPLYVLLFNTPNIGPGNNSAPLASVTLTSSSGSYSFPVTTGTYYLAAIYNAGGGGWYPGEPNTQPPNGDYYTAYGAANSGCDLRSSLAPVYVNGNTTGPALAFGDSCYYAQYGVSGPVSLLMGDGAPAAGTPLYVFAFTNPSDPFSSVWSGAVTQITSLPNNGTSYYGTYSLGGLWPGDYYIGAFYDSAGGASYSGGNNISVPAGEYQNYYDGTGDGGTCTPSSFYTVYVSNSNVALSQGVSVGTSCTTP